MNLEFFHAEIHRFTRSLAIYCYRHALHYYPGELLKHWIRNEGCIPPAVSHRAYCAYKAGIVPRRRLYKGPPHRPQLKIIHGSLHA